MKILVFGKDAKWLGDDPTDQMKNIEKLRDKDLYMWVKADVHRLLAPQGQFNKAMVKLPDTTTAIIMDLTETTKGTLDMKQEPVTKEKTRVISKGVEVPVYQFKRDKDELFGKFGEQYGIINKAFREILKARRAYKNIILRLKLVTIFPEFVSLGKRIPERDLKDPFLILEPRARGATMQLVGYEAVEKRSIEFGIRVNSCCTIDKSEVLEYLHGLDDFAIGPTTRGGMGITEAWYVKNPSKKLIDMANRVPVSFSEEPGGVS